jgi:LysR substrate binding domain.
MAVYRSAGRTRVGGRLRQPERWDLLSADGSGGAGCGIAMLPELEARRALNSGALKQVLPGYTPKSLAVYGIYLSRDYQPSALPLFLEAIQQQLSQVS